MDMNNMDWTKPAMTTGDFLDMVATLSDYIINDTYLDDIYQEEENGDTRYTEGAQDRFNQHFDNVETILRTFINIQSDEAVKISEAQI